jgi:formate dehydrogenase subunit gamma
MNRKLWLRVWLSLLVLGAVGALFSYTEAKYLPSGQGGTRLSHLFFDSVPWSIFAAAGLGFMLSSRTSRTGAFVTGDRVLRHDGGFMLGHWTLALSCVVLLATGFGLGLFVVPRVFPQSIWTAFLFNLHFVAALYFVFGFFYWVGNMVVTPKELRESLPDKNSPREAVLHYAHLFGLTKRTVEAGKFHASERLAFPVAVLTTLVIIVTGLFKVAARFVLMPEQVVYGMTFAHDLFTVVMLIFLLAHVTLGSVVPWAWPLLRSALTGYVSREYAIKEHPGWMKELEEGQKHG